MEEEEKLVNVLVTRDVRLEIRKEMDLKWKGIPRWEEKEERKIPPFDRERAILYCTYEERCILKKIYDLEWERQEAGIVRCLIPLDIAQEKKLKTIKEKNFKGTSPSRLCHEPDMTIIRTPRVRRKKSGSSKPSFYDWVYEKGEWTNVPVLSIQKLPVELRMKIANEAGLF